MGSLLTSDVPVVETLAKAQSLAARMHEADVVVPGEPVFFGIAGGSVLVAIFADGRTQQAERIAAEGGLSRIVAVA